MWLTSLSCSPLVEFVLCVEHEITRFSTCIFLTCSHFGGLRGFRGKKSPP